MLRRKWKEWLTSKTRMPPTRRLLMPERKPPRRSIRLLPPPVLATTSANAVSAAGAGTGAKAGRNLSKLGGSVTFQKFTVALNR